MNKRVRSSPRCSTSSPWPRRRGRRLSAYWGGDYLQAQLLQLGDHGAIDDEFIGAQAAKAGVCRPAPRTLEHSRGEQVGNVLEVRDQSAITVGDCVLRPHCRVEIPQRAVIVDVRHLGDDVEWVTLASQGAVEPLSIGVVGPRRTVDHAQYRL